MNDALNVGTIFHCDNIFDNNIIDNYNVVWRQTITGCKIVQLLQDIYKFNISYVIQHSQSNATNIVARDGAMYPHEDDNIDIYTTPMSLRPELLDYSYPVQALDKLRFGFILRRPEYVYLFQTFYSKPFAQPVWNCLYGITFIITLLLCLTKRLENHFFNYVPELGVTYEMLMVFGAYCQHIPPLHAILLSRRTVYFVFFMFAYVIYSFYTSNLLSHLVNDKDGGMDLERLGKSNYELAIVSELEVLRGYNLSTTCVHISTVENKLLNIKKISISEGLETLKSGKLALLTDYIALYPYVKQNFDRHDLCTLTMVDLFTNVKTYFFTSKKFKYKEQFKIGTLRALETGVLKRNVLSDFDLPRINCETAHLGPTQILQISSLLCALLGFYVLAVIIFIGERIHHQRNRLWPYVD